MNSHIYRSHLCTFQMSIALPVAQYICTSLNLVDDIKDCYLRVAINSGLIMVNPWTKINSFSNIALVQLSLYGDKDLSDDINKDILQLNLNFIHRTGRFG